MPASQGLMQPRNLMNWLVLSRLCLQGEVKDLAGFLGEPPNTDPAAMFGLLWEFSQRFDEAYLGILRHQEKGMGDGLSP